MGFFSKSDIPECEARFRSGSITSVNTEDRTFDIEIDGTPYEDVDVHYHCQNDWKEHSHPHSDADKASMMSAFIEGDNVNVMCQKDGTPLFVIGFMEEPRLCTAGTFIFPVIEKVYLTRDENDHEFCWWEGRFDYYIEDGGIGPAPTTRTPLQGVTLSFGTFDIIHFPYGTTVWINDEELSSFGWDGDDDDDWNLTGVPRTFKAMGNMLTGYFHIQVENTNYGEDFYVHAPYGFISHAETCTGTQTNHYVQVRLPAKEYNVWSAIHEACFVTRLAAEGAVGGWCVEKWVGEWEQRCRTDASEDAYEEVVWIWDCIHRDAADDPCYKASIYPDVCLSEDNCIGFCEPCEGTNPVTCFYDWTWILPTSAYAQMVFRVIDSHLESMFDDHNFEKPLDEAIDFYLGEGYPDGYDELQPT